MFLSIKKEREKRGEKEGKKRGRRKKEGETKLYCNHFLP
jgi:hypothetical protein